MEQLRFHKERFLNFIRFFLVRLGISPFILIYQFGKTGSQTVEVTIRKAKPLSLVLRTHFLQKDSYDATNKDLKKQISDVQVIYHAINKLSAKIQIIAAVREPVSTLLASYFQQYSLNFANHENGVLQRSAELFSTKPNDFIMNWFDAEFNRSLGIDVFAKPFPHDQGFTTFENEKFQVLLYRYENFNAIQSILEDFLNFKIPRIYSVNVGSEKYYKHIYQNVKKHLILSESFLRNIYDSKIAKHFYTDEERNGFIKYWSQPR